MAFLWLINRGDPNHLLTGMILQVDPSSNFEPGLHGTQGGFEILEETWWADVFFLLASEAFPNLAFNHFSA